MADAGETGRVTRRHERATIKDVARVSGVSLATVSNVINGTKKVRDETRRSVERAIEALSYRPNPIARSLIARRGRAVDTAPTGDRPRLISVGYASIDVIAPLPEPLRDGRRHTSAGIVKMLGGPATNVAVMAAALGEPFALGVELVTELGDDADSEWALEELAARGVDTAGAVRIAGRRLSRCIVLVAPDGRRTIVNEPLVITETAILAHLARADRPARRTLVHVDGFQVAVLRPVLAELKASGFLVSTHATGLAPALRTPKGLSSLLPLFDLVFLDREAGSAVAPCVAVGDTQQLVEAIDRLVQAHATATVILTLGAEGAVLLRAGGSPVASVAPVVPVVDSTGAGDAFAGIFLASWLTDGDAGDALARATYGASLSVTALGALGRTVVAADLPPLLRAPAGVACPAEAG